MFRKKYIFIFCMNLDINSINMIWYYIFSKVSYCVNITYIP